ncbi:MAG: hypothetical protein ABI840_05635 [bacterium]
MNLSKIEKGAALLFVLGFILRLLFLPFSGQLLIISCGVLAVIYFLSVTKNKLNISGLFSDTGEDITGNIFARFALRFAGFGLSTTVIGILFKILFWPNASFFLAVGIGTIIFSYIILRMKVRESLPVLFRKLALRIFIIGGVAFILYSTPTIDLFRLFHRDQPEYVEAVKAYWADPKNPELKKEVERLRKIH